jgi:predicted MFS family arabinose efflux permease
VSFVSGGISAFGPLILQGFGLGPFQTILYNMIPGAIAIVANIIAAFAVQTSKRKSPILLIILVFPVAAAAALYALPRGPEWTQRLLAVYFILQIFQPITPIIFSWAIANTAGHTKKTATTGALYIGLCVGNIVGPQLYMPSERPYYRTVSGRIQPQDHRC